MTRTQRPWGAYALAVLVFFEWGCGRTSLRQDVNIPEVLKTQGLDRYIGIEPFSTTTQGEWEVNRYAADSPAVCLEGDQFIVSVRRGDPKKAILYLEGGGGCWDYLSCYGIGMAQVMAGTPPAGDPGFLDTADPRNPLRDWSVVYASYCDGSVWSGDNNVVYSRDDGSDPRLTRHHGLANLSAAVTLLRKYFPNPDKVLVSGSSAGGYGTLMGYMVTKLQYPETPIYVINDSGPDVVNPQNPDLFEKARKAWNFEQFLPKGQVCPRCNEQMIYIVNWYLNNDRRVRYGIFSYYNDFIIGGIFLDMHGDDYKNLIISVTDWIHHNHPDRFKRFFVKGVLHTTLTLATYYSFETRGIPFYGWVGDLVNDSPDWADLLQ